MGRESFETFLRAAKRYGVHVPRIIQAQHEVRPVVRRQQLERVSELLSDKGRCVVTWNRRRRQAVVFTYEGYQRRVAQGKVIGARPRNGVKSA